MKDTHEWDALRAVHRHPLVSRAPVLVAGIALVALVIALVSTLGASATVAKAARAASDSSSDAASDAASESASESPVESAPADSSEAEELTVGGMLEPRQLRQIAPIRRWRTISTTDNTDGSGLVLPCQESRFADDEASGALLRSYRARPQKGQPGLQAWQFTELSQDVERARAGFDQLEQWYAGCAAPRMQLLETRTVSGVGNSAALFLLRSWRAPVTTYVVGVARTGKVTTTTVTARADATDPNLPAQVSRLAAAVNGLCGQAGAGRCAAPPSSRTIDPLPTGTVPGMLSEIDMPPVAKVTRPWVGTEPRAARQNFAATQCDETTFGKGQGVTNALTRTFVVPGGQLPDEFGVTQTVGTLPAGKAANFFSGIRGRVTDCASEDNGTDVESLSYRRSAAEEVIVWRMRITISDQATVPYLMGIARNGTAVTQIGFFPASDKTMGPASFVQLVERAQRRLGQMPKPVTAAPKSNNKNPKDRQQNTPRQNTPQPNNQGG